MSSENQEFLIAITVDLNAMHDYSNTDIDKNYDFYDESKKFLRNLSIHLDVSVHLKMTILWIPKCLINFFDLLVFYFSN